MKNNWQTKQLQELGIFDKGAGISKEDILAQGLPCIRYAEIYTKYDFQAKEFSSYISAETAKTSKPITQGTLLFAGSGETAEDIGKSVAYIGKPIAYASGDTIIFKFHNPKAIVLFYSYYLNTVGRKQLNKLGTGQSIVHIYPKELEKVEVPCPPIEEQRKIVEVLETWDKAITLTKQLIKQKELQKKYLMQQLLTGRTRLKGFTAYWTNTCLGTISNIYQPQTISTGDLTEKGYPVFGANGQIGFYNQFNHQTWQIMITCRGATCGTVNRTFGKAWITGNAMVINVDGHPEIDKLFLFYWLLSQNFCSIVSGSGQPQIVRSPLIKYHLHIPQNIEEQRAIASVLAFCDKEIYLLKQKLATLEEQKKGLMQALLTGKVRLVK